MPFSNNISSTSSDNNCTESPASICTGFLRPWNPSGRLDDPLRKAACQEHLSLIKDAQQHVSRPRTLLGLQWEYKYVKCWMETDAALKEERPFHLTSREQEAVLDAVNFAWLVRLHDCTNVHVSTDDFMRGIEIDVLKKNWHSLDTREELLREVWDAQTKSKRSYREKYVEELARLDAGDRARSELQNRRYGVRQAYIEKKALVLNKSTLAASHTGRVEKTYRNSAAGNAQVKAKSNTSPRPAPAEHVVRAPAVQARRQSNPKSVYAAQPQTTRGIACFTDRRVSAAVANDDSWVAALHKLRLPPHAIKGVCYPTGRRVSAEIANDFSWVAKVNAQRYACAT